MFKEIKNSAIWACAFVLLTFNLHGNSGKITIINKASVPIEVSGRKQIGINPPTFAKFEQNTTIESNAQLNLGDFTLLLDLKVRRESGKESCYNVMQLPTFENQKGHQGDDLTVTISLKKARWFWSKDTFTVSYNWSRPAINSDQQTIKKIDRPYWNDITHLKRSTFNQHQAPYIRRVYYFDKNNNNPVQEKLLNKPRQVLFSIHGTFARESKEFYDPDDKTFENILAYAESLGNSVEVVALEWTGKNAATDRIGAGQFLAGLMNDYYNDRQKYLSLNTISHSHGGNVVNAATHSISRPLDTIVSLYTPIRTDIDWFTPNTAKFKTLYHIYSTSDHIQFIGSINISRLNFSNILGDWGARKALISQNNNAQGDGGKIYNIRVEFTGISPAHVNKEAVVGYLPQLLWYINHTYKINYDLDADIDPTNKEILVSIRHSVSPSIINSQEATPEMKEQAQAETKASTASQAKYVIKYHKKMGGKGWRVINTLRSGKQTIFGN